MTSVVRGMRQYRRCSTTSARVNDCEGKTDRSGQSTGPTSLTGIENVEWIAIWSCLIWVKLELRSRVCGMLIGCEIHLREKGYKCHRRMSDAVQWLGVFQLKIEMKC